MLFYFDSLLFEFVFQPFAWKFERWTGKNNFFLSQCCSIAIAVIALLISFTIQDRDIGFYIVAYFICICGIMLTFTEFTARACDELDENGVNSNPIRNDSAVNKGAILLLYILILPLWLMFAILNLYEPDILLIEVFLMLSSIVASFYFLRCVPYPKERKVEKFFC